MHQTTVRFGPDLWSALEDECSVLGISAAQFVREATLARLSYAAGRRGEREFGVALAEAGASLGLNPAKRAAVLASAAADEKRSDSAAVSAQAELAMQRAQEARAHSERIRGEAKWRSS